MSNNYILEVKTVQAAAFRILTEALKEILTDANFVFDEMGLKVMAHGFFTYCISPFKINSG